MRQNIGVFFGQVLAEQEFLTRLLGADQGERWKSTLRLGFEQICEDVLPFELTTEQMPRVFTQQERTFELFFRQVFEEGKFAKLLVIVVNISARVERERSEKLAKEQFDIIKHLLADKRAFAASVEECTRLFATLMTEQDERQFRQDLHTLKGNTAILGFASISQQCHAAESLLDEGELPNSEVRAAIFTAWQARLRGLDDFLHADKKHGVELLDGEIEQFIEALTHRKDYKELLEVVETWKWDATIEPLAHLKAQTERLALKLNKNVEVQLEHNLLRVSPGKLDQFWQTLIHVIRNAVDHGIEFPEERLAKGKNARGVIRLTTRLHKSALLIEIEDDGRGLDEGKLLAAAYSKGVHAVTFLDALFADGVTTATEVTETSGRGVGLSAVKASCEKHGGTIAVRTTPGKGTIFAFRFRTFEEHRARMLSLAPPTVASSVTIPRYAPVGVAEVEDTKAAGEV